MVNGDLFVTVF